MRHLRRRPLSRLRERGELTPGTERIQREVCGWLADQLREEVAKRAARNAEEQGPPREWVSDAIMTGLLLAAVAVLLWLS